MPPSSAQARMYARHALEDVSLTPELDARILVAHALGVDATTLTFDEWRMLTPLEFETFNETVRRRSRGEPIAYITNVKEFWSLQLRTTPDALIPRPETELLVERLLVHCEHVQRPRVADLGTGCGAVAVALGSEIPAAQIVASDISFTSLKLAADNAQRLSLNNIELLLSDWLDAFQSESFQVIGANPPYIRDGDPCLDDITMQYEPRMALRGGTDGLNAIRRIVETAGRCLSSQAWLVFEHGSDQGQPARDMMRRAGFVQIATHRDLAGLERVTEGRKAV